MDNSSGADIQLEDGGWTRIHNRIWELLAQTNLTSREFRCLMFLFRQTYGYQKKSDAISLTQWANGTGIQKHHVKASLQRLEDRQIILRIAGKVGRGNTATYAFNKYFEQWITDAETTQKVPTGVPIKKVPCQVPFAEKKVPTGVTEKVPTGVPTKERKKQLQQRSRRDSEFVQAFEHCTGRVVASAWESEKIQEWEERVTLAAWQSTMEKCASTRPHSFWGYAESILRNYEQNGFQAQRNQPTTSNVLDVNWEEL